MWFSMRENTGGAAGNFLESLDLMYYELTCAKNIAVQRTQSCLMRASLTLSRIAAMVSAYGSMRIDLSCINNAARYFKDMRDERHATTASTMLSVSLLLLIAQFILLQTLSQANIFHAKFRPGDRCVQRFDKDPTHFEPCKSVPCFVFLSDEPYVVLDKNMTTEDSVKLFRCSDRKKVFPGLRGISFDIQDELPLDHALCVYGGPSCSFEGMMRFVHKQRKHQFIAGGLMFTLPSRMTEHTRPSSPLTEDKLVIIGPRDKRSAIVQAYTTVVRPFQFKTWMVILGVVLSFAVLRISAAICFSKPRTLKNILRHVLGEYESTRLQPLAENYEEDVRLLNRLAVLGLQVAMAAFLAIIILFYEIAIVNFVFLKKKHALQKTLGNLTPSEMQEYIIPAGGVTEQIWRTYVDPDNKYLNRTPPWQFSRTDNGCLDKIIDDEHPAKFSMSYESFIRHGLHRRKACDLLTVYETARPLYRFTAGWYYGAVPIQTQIKIDRAIIKLRIRDEIKEIINKEIVDAPVNCGALSADIPPWILGWLILTVVGACVLPVLASLIIGPIIMCMDRRHKARKESLV